MMKYYKPEHGRIQSPPDISDLDTWLKRRKYMKPAITGSVYTKLGCLIETGTIRHFVASEFHKMRNACADFLRCDNFSYADIMENIKNA